MFVPIRLRRHGLATSLLDSVSRHAGSWADVVQIELAVTATNKSAATLYRRFVFVE